MQVNKLLALLLSIQIGSQISYFGDQSKRISSNPQINNSSFSQLLKPNEIGFLELKSGNQPLYYGTFMDVKEENISTCSVSTTNSQQVELKSAREENLKLQKTIGELRGIISKSGGICTIDEKSLEKELDILKKANLFIIKLLEKSTQSSGSSQGQLSLDILNDMRLSMSRMQGQSDQILDLLLQMQLKINQDTCSDLQLTLEQEMQRILARLETSFEKQDSLLKTNQDLNSLILNMQQEKEGLQNQLSSFREQRIQTDNLQNQNQNIEKIISSMQNGDQEIGEVMSQLRVIALSNQALTTKLDRLENNKQNTTDFDNLKQQNSQLQILVKNLGDQLFEQTQKFTKQQDFENQMTGLKAERDQLAQKLAEKTKDFEELKTQNKTQVESLNSQLEALKIDIAVSQSGQKALESQIQDSRGQFSNFAIILSENKNLTEQLTKCLAEKEVINRNMTNLSSDQQTFNQCNDQLTSLQSSNNTIKEEMKSLEDQNGELRIQVAIISSLNNQIDGLKQQNQDLRNQNSKLSGLQDQFKNVQNELQDRNSLLVQISKLQSDNQNQNDQCQTQLRFLQTQMDQNSSQLQQCNQEKEKVSQQFITQGNGTETELTDLRKTNLELNNQATKFETLNSECRSSLNFYLNVEEQMRKIQERLNQTLQENEKQRNDNQILQNEKSSQALEIATIPQLKNQISQLETQNKALLNFNSTIDSLQNSIRSNQETQNQFEQQRSEFQSVLDSCNNQLNELKIQVNESKAIIQSLDQRNTDLQGSIQSLREGNNDLQSLGQNNQQLLDRVFQLESRNQSCGAVEQNLQSLQSTIQSTQEELKTFRSQANECNSNLTNAKDRILGFEAAVLRIPILERALNNSEQQVSDLRNRNNSFVNIQTQITEFLTQLREKQALEVENTQLKRDLENLRNFFNQEQKKFSDQSVSFNSQLSTCNNDTKTLQEQLMQMRNSDENVKKLQNDFNNCQNRLRTLEEQNNGFILEIRNLNEFRSVFDKQTTQFNQIQNDLRKCQETSQTLRGDNSALKLQTSQISNYQSQIEGLNKEVADLQSQNKVLINLSTQIKTISDNNERIQSLNNQIRGLVADNNKLQQDCQREKTQLELQMNTFKQESQTCKSQNDQLKKDIQVIGDRQGSSQQTLQQENSSIRQDNLKLQGEISDCRANFQRVQQENNRISTLTKNVQDCNQQKVDLENRVQELLIRVEIVDQLNQNNQQLNGQVITLQKELQNYQNLKEQIERFQNIFSQNVSLNAEINRLKDLLANSQNSSQTSQGDLQLQITKLKSEFDSCQESKKQQESNLLRLEQGSANFSTILQENRGLTERILQLTSEKQDCERRVAQFQQTSQSVLTLRQQLDETNKKLEECNSQNVSLLIQTNTIPQFQGRLVDLQSQISDLNGRNQNLNQINQELAGLRGILTERNNLQTQLDNLRQEKATRDQECNQQLSNFRVQIQTLASNLDNCNKQGEGFKTQIQSLASRQPQVQEIQQQNAVLSSQISALRDNLTTSQTTIETLKNQLKECQGLQNILNSSNSQLQGLQLTIVELREQITRCNQNDQIITQLRSQLQDRAALQTQLDTLKGNFSSSQAKVDEFNALVISIRNENQSLQAKLNQCNQQSQQESASLRAQIQEKDNTIKGLNQRIVVLTTDSNNLKNEIQNLNQSIQSSSSSTQNLAGQIRDLQNQRSQLEDRINQISTQLKASQQSLTIKTQELQQAQTSGQSSIQGMNSLQNQLNTLQVNYQTLQTELSTCNQQRTQLQEQNINLTKGLQESRNLVQSLQVQLQESQGQLDTLRVNLSNSQSAISDLNGQLLNLRTRLESSSQSQTTQISTLNKDKEKLTTQVDQLSKNNQSLLVQLQELTVQIEDCGRVRQQRDLYARQLISFQNRLQQFRDNVLVNTPQSGTQSAAINNAQSSLTTTTQTIKTTNLDGNQQNISSSGIQQQLSTCLTQLETFKNQNEQLVLRVERNQEKTKNDY